MGRDSGASTISYIFKMFFHVVSKDSFLRRRSCLSRGSRLHSCAAGAARVFSYVKNFEVVTIGRNTILI